MVSHAARYRLTFHTPGTPDPKPFYYYDLACRAGIDAELFSRYYGGSVSVVHCVTCETLATYVDGRLVAPESALLQPEQQDQ